MNHDLGRRNIKLALNENAGQFSASDTLRKKPEKGSVQASYVAGACQGKVEEKYSNDDSHHRC
jgi:hypothetical protein